MPDPTPTAEKFAMRLIAIAGYCRKNIILGLALAFILLTRPAAGAPEWGTSSGAALFMIRVEAIKSPPLSGIAAVLGRTHNPFGPGLPDSSSWLEGYQVSLTNVTMVPWLNPAIEYVVYAMDANGQIQRVYGTEQLSEIPVNGEITFVTNQVVMQPAFRALGRNSQPGKLLGVRVRIYDYRHLLVQDYAAPWVLMIWQRWEYPLTTEGGGTITPRIRGVLLNG
jgi:hypothetical protein